MYSPISNELFHVHTFRCGHAGNDQDEAYVLKALECGKARIVFTDHTPFPDDRFGSRMKMAEFDGYLRSIRSLKEKYSDKIEVFCGLEAEYFPMYTAFYEELKDMKDIDVLMLGQHMYMHEDGSFNFMDKDRSGEYEGISEAITEGLNTGYFDVLAHPDRMCMRYGKIDDTVIPFIRKVSDAANNKGVFLEKNYSSMFREHNYFDSFWNHIGNAKTLMGYDAHSVNDIDFIHDALAEGKEPKLVK